MLIITQNKTLGFARDMVNRMPLGGRELFSYEIQALGFLAKRLVETKLWDKIMAIYPFVGRSGDCFKLNLKNNSYTLSYSGTFIFSSLGISCNGNNSNAVLTGINIPSLNQFSIACGVYRTNLGGVTNNVSTDFGSSYTPTGNNNRFYMLKDSTDATNFNGAVGFGGIGAAGTSQGSLTGLGFKMFSCENSGATGFKCWNNGINTYTSSGNRIWQEAGQIYLLSLSGNPVYVTRQTLGLFFASSGLTDDESYNLSNIIEIFQQILIRSYKS